MKKTGVGVIGTGFIGPVHIEALRRLGFVEVMALADKNMDVARARAKQLNIADVYGDYKELIEDERVECVHICVPNNLHYSIAKDVIAAGKHVVCDKPLAITTKEAKELVVLAKEKKVVAALNFNIRFYPLLYQLKSMVEHGDLGRIFSINGSYQQDWLQKETDYSWRLEPDKSGESRAIADIGSHWMDAIEFITGLKISKVCADMATFYPIRKKPLKPVETYSGKMLLPDDYEEVSIQTEDYATVLLRFVNGVHGSLTVNQVAAGRKNRMYFEIYGSKAAAAFDSEKPNYLWIGKRDGNNELMIKDPSLVYEAAREIIGYPGGHTEGFADTFKQCFTKIYRYIQSGQTAGKPDFPTFEDGLRDMVLCETILASGKQEKWLEVN
jgi:predicted dehydrogenase